MSGPAVLFATILFFSLGLITGALAQSYAPSLPAPPQYYDPPPPAPVAPEAYPPPEPQIYTPPPAPAQSFSLPEGSNSPQYIEPLVGNGRPSQHGPQIKSFYQQGFASDQSIVAKVGELKFNMVSCDQSNKLTDHRVVRVELSGTDFEYGNIVDGILLRAAEFAWQTCPRIYPTILVGRSDYYYNLSEVNVYLPDGALALVASLGGYPHGDAPIWSGDEYSWTVRNVVAEERQRAAENAVRAQQAQAAAAQAQSIAEANARSAAEWNRFWSNVWLGIKLLFWGAIAAWLFSMREIIMRWYYFLTPHPAESMVEAAIHSGVELDGKAFADIMRPMPGGRIEKEVRAEQARKLTEKAHRYAETMRVEAERIKAEAQRDTEYIKAHDELAQAAIVHEKAKARLDALRKRVG